MPPAPFQALTTKSTGRAAKLITPISVSQAFDPAKAPQPLPNRIETSALWDTGATGSVISAELAKSIGLVPVGRVNVNHAGGASPSPTYLVNFTLPNQVTMTGNLVTEFPSLPGDFSVIVGMDVITFGDFAVTNVGGKTWMSFRMPSCVAIDYVAEAHRLEFAGVGRNDPCPCGKQDGAGKRIKFKRCHGV